MSKISKKAFETVVLPSVTTAKVVVCYEAYGRQVCGYMSTPEGMTRPAFESALEAKGCKVNRSYWPGSKRVEVSNISYFKAFGWDK